MCKVKYKDHRILIQTNSHIYRFHEKHFFFFFLRIFIETLDNFSSNGIIGINSKEIISIT